MRRTIFRWGGAAAFLFLLASRAMASDQDNPGVWLIYSASDYAEDIDFLYRVIFWVTFGMFVLTEGLLLLFCVIYRRRPGHRPTYTHGSQKAEITWTIIPALMLLGLAIWQIPTWNHIKKRFPKDGENGQKVNTYDFLGEQFKWSVRYPGTKDQFKLKNDFSIYSQVHLPFGNAAFFNLRTKDVIHSVFIPHMRVKQDTVPGLRQRLWFRPNRYFLVDLKAAAHQDGTYYVQEDQEWVKKPRMVQERVWINLDSGNPDKDFLPGGKFYDKRVVIFGHNEVNGMYEAVKFQGNPKKVRVLYKGAVMQDQEFASCDYALGIYEIACAELCGLGHSTMRAFLYVEPKICYDTFLKVETEDFEEPNSAAWKYWRD